MMWPMSVYSLITFSGAESWLISTVLETCAEIKNVIIMTFMSMVINQFMMMKAATKAENFMWGVMKLISFMVIGAFLTKSPFFFLVFMEATVFPMALIILNSSKDSDKMESVKFMVLMNTIGSIPFMMFLSVGNKEFYFAESSDFLMMMSVMLFLAKTPIMMFHLWLTKVHVSASGSCSMILASIMIKLGTLGLFKFSLVPSEKLMTMFLGMGLYSSLLFSMTMMRFFDVKTLIAMSSVLHMALLTPMMLLKTDMGMVSSVMMMTGHGLISYFLFFMIALKYEQKEGRSIFAMKSIESTSKMLTMMSVIFIFLNLGMPPMINFYAEMMILAVMKSMSSAASVVMFLFSLLFSVIFTVQFNVSLMYSKKELWMKKNSGGVVTILFLYFLLWVALIEWFI